MKLDKVEFSENLLDLTQFQNWRDIREDKRLKTFFHIPSLEILNFGRSHDQKYSTEFLRWFNSLPLKNVRNILDYIFYTQFMQKGKIKFIISPTQEIEGFLFFTLVGNPIRMESETVVRNVGVIQFRDIDISEEVCNMYALMRNTYELVEWVTSKDDPNNSFYMKLCGECEKLPIDIYGFKLGRGSNTINLEEILLKEGSLPFKFSSFLFSEIMILYYLKESSLLSPCKEKYLKKLEEEDET